jgi:hypothetical protein
MRLRNAAIASPCLPALTALATTPPLSCRMPLGRPCYPSSSRSCPHSAPCARPAISELPGPRWSYLRTRALRRISSSLRRFTLVHAFLEVSRARVARFDGAFRDRVRATASHAATGYLLFTLSAGKLPVRSQTDRAPRGTSRFLSRLRSDRFGWICDGPLIR